MNRKKFQYNKHQRNKSISIKGGLQKIKSAKLWTLSKQGGGGSGISVKVSKPYQGSKMEPSQCY